jgi:hypothetical protein
MAEEGGGRVCVCAEDDINMGVRKQHKICAKRHTEELHNLCVSAFIII